MSCPKIGLHKKRCKMGRKAGKSKRYARELKQKVVLEYLRGEETQKEVLNRYGIRGSSTLTNWIRQLGYEDEYERGIFPKTKALSEFKKEKKSQSARKSALEQENEQLRLKLELYERMIKKAEEVYQIKIEKKFDSK